ncbi:hypothetical protein DID75_03280, partial [Candidatus Marinamargulisbacteria bacterium SCGC AG-410-N11]
TEAITESKLSDNAFITNAITINDHILFQASDDIYKKVTPTDLQNLISTPDEKSGLRNNPKNQKLEFDILSLPESTNDKSINDSLIIFEQNTNIHKRLSIKNLAPLVATFNTALKNGGVTINTQQEVSLDFSELTEASDTSLNDYISIYDTGSAGNPQKRLTLTNFLTFLKPKVATFNVANLNSGIKIEDNKVSLDIATLSTTNSFTDHYVAIQTDNGTPEKITINNLLTSNNINITTTELTSSANLVFLDESGETPKTGAVISYSPTELTDPAFSEPYNFTLHSKNSGMLLKANGFVLAKNTDNGKSDLLVNNTPENNIISEDFFVFKDNEKTMGAFKSQYNVKSKQTNFIYESKGADYAEYIEQIDSKEIINAGDIVGVYNGKITKRTKDAHRIMAISSQPIIIGNGLTTFKNKAQAVAFIGQVPVNVSGPVQAGDYIIPSGEENGTGIAIHPEDLTAEDIKLIIGQAWESSLDKSTKVINVAITTLDNPTQYISSIVENQTKIEQENERLKYTVNELKESINQLLIRLETIESRNQ